ncbi:alanine racemase [Streptomyces platensis]|uniref:alanine racemase n=1 Tax=Streptomyces platensis TaxID=58346 RepID=UPI002253080C|nr:alanine racemase [Streptomyces platensis]MCX4640545.1 alanine racemase [Streptomyces platensis]
MSFGMAREAENVEAGYGAAVTAVVDGRPLGVSGGPVPSADDQQAGTPHAQARIDLAAIRANVSRLCDTAGPAEVMAVVKADAYGHGAVPVARAALAGGATWLGVAGMREALALRAAGVTGRLLAWLLTPGDDWSAAVAAGVELSAGAPWAVRAAVRAAQAVDRPALLHLEAETGLGRGGAAAGDWRTLVDSAASAEAAGYLRVVGVWSHLARADEPGHPSCKGQLATFRDAAGIARRAGLAPDVLHLSNSAATLTLPEAHFDLVRPGLAVYGLSPVPDLAGPSELGLRPAMTLTARLASVKRVPAGQGVSYSHRYRTARETTLGLVPLGYADGVPRHASQAGPVLVAGRQHTVAGTVCMDQFVVDLGDASAAPGDEVVLFGPGERGEPGAADWARAAHTISHEIVTRIGARVPRAYTGGSASRDH